MTVEVVLDRFAEPKYFCKWGWTRMSTSRPTGKSADVGQSKFSRVPDAVQRSARAEADAEYR
jgi:hypothetical protein